MLPCLPGPISSRARRVCALCVCGILGLAPAPSVRAQAPVATIHRDAWGVPHVFSETDAGVVFGMAWALAEDDWALVEENYLRALGRLAELNGEDAVSGDSSQTRRCAMIPRRLYMFLLVIITVSCVDRLEAQQHAPDDSIARAASVFSLHYTAPQDVPPTND